MTFGQQGDSAEGIRRLNQLDAGKLASQVFDHRIALGDRQFLPFELAQIGRTVGALARQQHIGVFQIGSTEAQGFFPFGSWKEGGDKVGLMPVYLLDHLRVVTAAPDLETQAGAQTDQFEKVGADTAKIAVAVEEGQRRVCLIHDHTDDGMPVAPCFFALGQLQLLVGEQQIAAGAPAFGDVFTLAARHRFEYGVDNAQQLRIVAAYGETETVGFLLAEIGHAHVVEVALVDHVVRGNGVAEKYIGLIERDCVDRILVGGIAGNQGFGVQRLDLMQRQIVINHAQAQSCQAFGQCPAFVLAGHEHRLIIGVGFGQRKVGVAGFIAVGRTEQVDLTIDQRANRGLPGGKTFDPDRHPGSLADNPGIVGGQTFVVLATDGHVKRRIVRRGSAQ